MGGKTSTEVKQRWISANYQRYNVNLRLDSDGELIDMINAYKDEGFNTTEVFREALQALYEKEKK